MPSINCIDILEKEAASLKRKIPKNFKKIIAILLTTEDMPSNKYVNLKVKMLKEIGINVVVTNKQRASEEFIFNWIVERNCDDSCFGSIIQYPVSTNDRETVANLIIPSKDIDALSSYWFKVLLEDDLETAFIPPTAFGCLEIIKRERQEGNVLVIGESQLTGLPIKMILSKHGFNVTSCNEKTTWEEKKDMVKKSQIVVSTVGKGNVIDEKWIQPNHLVIDFGRRYFDGKAIGDIDNKKINKNSTYTSIYKSTGYATLAGILRNIRIKIEGLIINE